MPKTQKISESYGAPHSPPLATASAPYVFGYFATCLDIGAERQTMLDILNCENDILNNPVRRFACDDVLDMLSYAERETGIGSIGLLAGRTFRPETFQALGYAYISCNSLCHIMELSRKYQKLTQEFGQISFAIDDKYAKVYWKPYIEDAERLRIVTEAVYTAYVSISRWLLWQYREKVVSVSFRHGPPKGTDLCAEYFGCEILYDQPEDCLTAEADLFHIKLPQANPELLKILEARLSRDLEQLENHHLFENKVRQTINHFLATRPVSLPIVAEAIGVSPQKLSRRLAQEGTSFRQLLQKVRQENVEFYLQEGRKNLTEIAMALGYSDQSAFTRAYKDWYGEIPSLRKSVGKSA